MRILFIILGKPFTFILKIIVIIALFFVKVLSVIQLPSIALPHFQISQIPKVSLPKLSIPNIRYSHLVTPLITTMALLLITSLIKTWFLNLPSPSLLQNPPSLTTKIVDRNGILLYKIYRDENRSLVKIGDLPSNFINATLAIEDKNFYSHHGLDFGGILRAFIKNLRNCRFYTTPCTQEGGSTITQQLIKNTILSPEKSVGRKLTEAVLALRVERQYSKDEILELYINEVNYGGTAYGIQAAADYYFNKQASDLTLSESALLAGLTTSPTILSPLGSRPYLAKDRQLQVLTRMYENGYITQSEKEEAGASPIVLHPNSSNILAPHFVMWLKEKLVNEFGEATISQGGLTITTTLDLSKQQILESAISQELSRLNNLKVTNAAGLITNPATGEILAMVGSHDYKDYAKGGQVNVTDAERQPGSSIKAITYTLALMHGLGPNNTIDDSPICFTAKGSDPYCPKNYDGRFHGTVTLRTALASSYNVPAVKLLNGLGISNMINLAKQMGITTWNDPSRYGLALTLGGGEVKMTDMAEVYGTLANGGTHVPLKSILKIEDSTGNDLQSTTYNLQSTEVFSPTVAFQINSILSDNNARSPAFGFNSVLNIPKNQVAVKTGTTNSLRDNWTFGYTKDILVATWVGNNDNTPMSAVASGITGASPIWRHTMDKLLEGKSPNVFAPPVGVKKIALCRETKGIYCKGICPSAPVYEYFAEGSEPKGSCSDQSGTLLPAAAKTN